MIDLAAARAFALKQAEADVALKAQALRTEIVADLSKAGTGRAYFRRTYKVISHNAARKLGLKGRTVITGSGNLKTRVRNSYKVHVASAPGQAPVVDLGDLRKSISAVKIGPGHWQVGTNKDYAPLLEFGTRDMKARPFFRPALDKIRVR